uniref:Uncharacterized protein n=1 Tax=Daucus carota subsp. sativus TaxID=79200 RepID=A0A166FPW6_DAUCS|nr:PREDICTED: uncharacterized protein LOC108196789 [Daucus carota subsp. sativus]
MKEGRQRTDDLLMTQKTCVNIFTLLLPWFAPASKTDPIEEDKKIARALRHIYQDDLMQFMRDDEALMIISHFKGASGRKGISMKQLNNWMIIYRFVWTAKTIIILVYIHSRSEESWYRP